MNFYRTSYSKFFIIISLESARAWLLGERLLKPGHWQKSCLRCGSESTIKRKYRTYLTRTNLKVEIEWFVNIYLVLKSFGHVLKCRKKRFSIQYCLYCLVNLENLLLNKNYVLECGTNK